MPETPGTYTPNLAESEQTIFAELTDPAVLELAEAIQLERRNIEQRIGELLKNYQGWLSQNVELRDDLIELAKEIEAGEFAAQLAG